MPHLALGRRTQRLQLDVLRMAGECTKIHSGVNPSSKLGGRNAEVSGVWGGGVLLRTGNTPTRERVWEGAHFFRAMLAQSAVMRQ